MAKKYEIVVRDGQELRDYGDGTLRRADGTIAISSSVISRDKAMQRWSNGQAATMNALMKELGANSPEEAVEMLMMKKVRVAFDDDTRVGTETAFRILRQAGYAPENNTNIQGVVQHVVTPNFSQRYWEYMKKQEVIDAEVEDD